VKTPRKRPHTSTLTPEDASDNPSTSKSEKFSSLKKKIKAHNNMERMRRIDLRSSFDNLKVQVFAPGDPPKCSKIEILKLARICIGQLKMQEMQLENEERNLRRRISELKNVF